jgi:hypothetical protein
MTSADLAMRRSGRLWWAWAACAALVALMIVGMKLEGQPWRCACGTTKLWVGDVWTEHCSQHPLDPYSVTHFSHGLIFDWMFTGLVAVWSRRQGNAGGVLVKTSPRGSGVGWKLCASVALAAGWEVLENSPFIINRFRESTMSLNYLGDSVTNSVFDVFCCIAGFWVARWIGLWKTAAIFVVSEIALVILIRDSLVLSTFMLVWPVEWIKQWQLEAAKGVEAASLHFRRW